MPNLAKSKARAAKRREAQENLFAATYISNGRNAANAYKRVFPGVKNTTAASNGYRWLNNASVQEKIAKITADAWKQEHMTAEEVLGRMARIARMDIGDYYWKPGELDRSGQPTVPNQRKPLSELTEVQRECIKGYKFSATGLVIQEHHDKPQQLGQIAKHLKLLNDNPNINLTIPLDKMIEQSYGDNKEDATQA